MTTSAAARRSSPAAADKPYAKSTTRRLVRDQVRAEADPYGFLDDDDPDRERVIRQHAAAAGKDPDAEVASDTWRRQMREAQDIDSGDAGTTPAPAAAAGTRRARPAPSSNPAGIGSPTLRLPSSPSWSDGSGFLFGLVLYALGTAYLRGGLTGRGGVSDWFAAKFLNRTRGGQ